MQVVFRFDSGTHIGMGHLMRCLTLAEALRRRGATLLFICRPETAKALKTYWPGARCHILPPGLSEQQDAARCRSIIARLRCKPDWLIVDHYGLGKTWEMRMRPMVQRLMAIDDMGRGHDADLLLDANVISGKHHYQGKIPPRCRLLLGPRYALLRREFQFTKRAETTPRAFVCFGGSDPNDMTSHIAEMLAGFSPGNVAIDIVVGYSYANKNMLAALCEKYSNWRLFINHKHPEQLMAQATLAIGAGGTMIWERCAMGLPSIVISIADNQRSICETLAAQGIIHYLGDKVEAATLRDAVNALLSDEKARAKMAAASRALVNVKGADLVASRMSDL